MDKRVRGRDRNPLTWNIQDVANIFDNSHLEAEADAEERDFLLASPFDGKDHAFCAALSEASGNENAPVVRSSQFRVAANLRHRNTTYFAEQSDCQAA